MAEWRSRIVGHGQEAPDQLLANPRNWRIHPKAQQDALAGVLSEVGWVQDVIVNQRTGQVVDGHARVALAISREESFVPVVYVDLDENEEGIVLAALDPLAAMAVQDPEKWRDLLADITVTDDALREALSPIESATPADSRPSLADRFVVPPFSVLDARQGYWQERKRQWLATGIQSELGRGDNALGLSSESEDYRRNRGNYAKANATPGGSPRPAAQLGNLGKTTRGDGAGRRLTYVAGNRPKDELDPVRAMILESGSGTSIFDPVLCELVYRWFSPPAGAVLDPFAGGSVRGIVASMLGRAYTGVDLSARQLEANRGQAAAITPNAPPTWHHGDSAEIAVLAPGAYDLIFSCPPYADLEVYSDDPRDISTMPYADFLAAYREIIAASVAMLKPDRFACFVVGDVRDRRGFYRNLVSHTIEAFQYVGAVLYNEAILVTAVGSLSIRVGRQFVAGRKLGKTHQNILVFCKGDPKKAVEACGTIEVELPLTEGDIDRAP